MLLRLANLDGIFWQPSLKYVVQALGDQPGPGGAFLRLICTLFVICNEMKNENDIQELGHSGMWRGGHRKDKSRHVSIKWIIKLTGQMKTKVQNDCLENGPKPCMLEVKSCENHVESFLTNEWSELCLWFRQISIYCPGGCSPGCLSPSLKLRNVIAGRDHRFFQLTVESWVMLILILLLPSHATIISTVWSMLMSLLSNTVGLIWMM